MKKKIKEYKCICCGQIFKIDKMMIGPRSAFCTNCSFYHKDLIKRLRSQTYQLKQFRKKLYGFERGTERIRFKEDFKK